MGLFSSDKKPSAFDTDPQTAAMREELADRQFNLKIKQGLFSLAGAAVGAGAGFAIGDPVGGANISTAVLGGTTGLMAGGMVGDVVTTKDRTRLDIDRQIADARIQGQGWWGGYHEQNAAHGNQAPAMMPPAAAPTPVTQAARDRRRPALAA